AHAEDRRLERAQAAALETRTPEPAGREQQVEVVLALDGWDQPVHEVARLDQGDVERPAVEADDRRGRLKVGGQGVEHRPPLGGAARKAGGGGDAVGRGGAGPTEEAGGRGAAAEPRGPGVEEERGGGPEPAGAAGAPDPPGRAGGRGGGVPERGRAVPMGE